MSSNLAINSNNLPGSPAQYIASTPYSPKSPPIYESREDEKILVPSTPPTQDYERSTPVESWQTFHSVLSQRLPDDSDLFASDSQRLADYQLARAKAKLDNWVNLNKLQKYKLKIAFIKEKQKLQLIKNESKKRKREQEEEEYEQVEQVVEEESENEPNKIMEETKQEEIEEFTPTPTIEPKSKKSRI